MMRRSTLLPGDVYLCDVGMIERSLLLKDVARRLNIERKSRRGVARLRQIA
jgi:hypothetical protein